MTINDATKKLIEGFQRNEITEYHIYRALSRLAKTAHNKEVLKKISDEEMRHYLIWQKYTGRKIKPDNKKRWFYVMISALFGVTFAIKLMEKGESNAQDAYEKISSSVPDAAEIKKEEEGHEQELIGMIDEVKLAYMGSVVLGLNDALVEFTGALAGFTFALQNPRLIGMTGIIMGLAASLSMAASEYLSTKAEEGEKNPLRAAFYTGTAYVVTVVALVSPFLMLQNQYVALFLTLSLAALLILVFTFYYSVVKDIEFRPRFVEMLSISMGVAGISFIMGLVIKKAFGVDA